ncbi:MAG: dihydrofolate reductase family protein [Solirubrobacteraceae bacterium]
MLLRRLIADSGEVDVDRLIGGLDLASRAPERRPYTLVNFVASADGRATVHNRSGGLGDEGDRRVFRALRSVADAVLAGTGTLRAERYGRLIKDPERRRERELRGLAPEPIACTVTRSGVLATDIPLFAEPDARVVVFSAAPVDLGAARAAVEVVVSEPAELTMTAVLQALRGRYGVRLALCEGGPRLFAALLAEQLVDELFLTVAPKLAVGTGPAITDGPALPELTKLALAWALQSGDSLHLRYTIEN